MKFLLILISLFFFSSILSAQNYLKLIFGNETKEIPAYEREGTLYFSLQDFAESLSINYYLNEKNKKLELKFGDYLLKVTPKNPYIIVTPRKTGIPNIYQLPTSTYLVKEKIYLPLISSISAMENSFGKKLTFREPNILLIGDVIPDDEKKWVYDDTGESTSLNFDINNISIDQKANGTLIRVHSKKRIPSYYSSFKDGVLTIIFRKVNADTTRTNKKNLGGLLKEIETENIGSDVEFRFKVGSDYSTNEVLNAPESQDILITIHNRIFKQDNETEKHIEKWDFDAVVIDAGHGGKDPGAIGVSKVKEKDVNLSVALKLGKLIEEKMPDIKVVYTRKSDVFIDLYKRGKIANEQKGSLFISVHCNSTKKKPSDSNGIEVYLLRPGRTQEAIEIAERENSVIEFEEDPNRYEKLNDENFILVSMAHASYMKYSEKFADFLNKEFTTNLKLKSRGVKQAGFYVLVGASMPSVLIETGFLSNKSDEAFLKSKNGQQKLAESIFGAIKTYRDYYEKEMQAGL